MSPETLAHLAEAAVVAVLGFLLKRSIDGVDKGLSRLDGKVDVLAGKDSEHDKSLAKLDAQVERLRDEMTEVRLWRNDVGGFFAALGFKKRNGSEP